jgi:DNA-binding transcriptional LysR family regulator
MLDLEKVRSFVAVVRTGSFVGAAEELNLSQPAVSRSVQALERQFGVRLLDRHRAGVRVTPVGKQVLERALDLLSNARAMEKTLSAASSGLAGTVRFGVGPFTATALLPQTLAPLAASGASLRVEVTMSSRTAMTKQLLDDEIEFFIGVQDDLVGDATYSCLALAEISPRFFVRPDHPLTSRTPTIAEIEAYPIASGTELGSVFDIGRRAAGQPPTILVNNVQVLGEVCLSTDTVLIAGAGAIPPGLVEVSLAETGSSSRSTLGIVSVRNRTLSPAAEQMRSELIRVARTVYP